MNRTIEVHSLSRRVWRITDARLAPEDPRALLGFIEQKAEGFEAMKLGTQFSWLTFDSLHEAIDHFAQGLVEEAAPEEHVLSWMLTSA